MTFSFFKKKKKKEKEELLRSHLDWSSLDTLAHILLLNPTLFCQKRNAIYCQIYLLNLIFVFVNQYLLYFKRIQAMFMNLLSRSYSVALHIDCYTATLWKICHPDLQHCHDFHHRNKQANKQKTHCVPTGTSNSVASRLWTCEGC